MKTISLVLLSMLIEIGCSKHSLTVQEKIDNIFTSKFEHSIISKGDNLPDFNRRKDSIDLFLVALHEGIEPVKFQARAGWSDEKLKEKTQILISKGWLINDNKGLRPTVFIATDQQGKDLFIYGKPLAAAIAQSIESEIPFIKEKYETAGFSEKYDFNSMSFLILSDVLLDNWQLMHMEAAYLKKENRPERHGKFYYASIMENTHHDYEPFGIYGNQYGQINDSTYLSIYGNNRIIVNKRLKSDPAFRDSVLQAAIYLTPELYRFFEEIATDFRPKLLKILDEQTDYSRKIFEKSGYSNEISYEEFFIWWYHFIYTEATNILAERHVLVIPGEGNLYYR